MHVRFVGLWRSRDFLRLWAAQTLSRFGSQITFLALPLAAVLVLDATPLQVGILTAAGGLPALVIGPLVGAWVDRRRRRPVLIAADWVRAALLLAIPTMALLNVLRIEFLYLLAFGLGAMGLFFDVAYRSFLPVLVGRTRIVEANSKLEVSRSAAEIAGPAAGGALVQLVTAPIALIADSITFLASALLLRGVCTPEPEPPADQRHSIWREAGEGLKLVGTSPVLRALAGCAGTISLFSTILETVAILYMVRQLALSPGLLGLIFATGSVGLLAGAFLVQNATERIGLGPVVVGGAMLFALGDLALPLAGGPRPILIISLVVGQMLFGVGLTTYRIGQVSLRQAITADHLQGRMNATMSVVAVGAVPVGALAGGVLGEAIGLRPTLFVAVLGEFLAVGWLLLSLVRTLREQPSLGL